MAQLFCSQCGGSLTLTSKFCGECGNKVNIGPPVVGQVEAAAAPLRPAFEDGSSIEVYRHWLVLIPSLVAGLFAVICAGQISGWFLIILLWPIASLIKWRRTKLILADRRVYGATGVLDLQTIDLRLDKLESIVFTQSLFGRMWNFGDLQVRGTGSTTMYFKHIANAKWFKEQVDTQLDYRQV